MRERVPQKRSLIAASLVSVLAVANHGAMAELYADFPVTVKDYAGSKKTSVSYAGQTARHLLHESLKKLAAQGNGSPNAALKARMMAYFSGQGPGRAIVAPGGNGEFVFLQQSIDDISEGKDLAGKTYKGTVQAWPGYLTGTEVVEFWIDKASQAEGGYDAANGYDYPQLISKFLMGAVFYSQIADVYLDEHLEADNKPNNQPYSEEAAYTGKEHSWDEAFGYFGAPAHAARLAPEQAYEIAKMGSHSPADALKLADHSGDGKVDYVSEMTYALAYYASSYDKSGKTSYFHNINNAFVEGRKLLASADGAALTDTQRNQLKAYARIVKENLERVLAESVFKYAGETYEDIEKLNAVMESGGNPAKVMRDYVKHWGELKGFSMAIQMGGKDLGEIAVTLNRLIGFGPVLPNASQVIDVDSSGNYVKDQAVSLDEYALHMLKVQKLMSDRYQLGAKSHDQLARLGRLMEQLGGGSSAEND